jgi:predicted DNA-binding transcriptional regulator AlpA
MKKLLTLEQANEGLGKPTQFPIVTDFRTDARPAVVDLPHAAAMLGIGRTLAYRLVREGAWPTPVIRVGRLIKVPLQPPPRVSRRAWGGTLLNDCDA